MESENQVLRQQALTMSPTGKAISARPRTTIVQVMLIYFGYFPSDYLMAETFLLFPGGITENS